MRQPAHAAGFPLPARRLVIAKARLNPPASAVLPHEFPPRRQVAEHHQRLRVAHRPHRHHTGRPPARLLEHPPAALPPAAGTGHVLLHHLPQCPLTPALVAKAQVPAHLRAHQPVPALRRCPVHERRHIERPVGRRYHRQVGGDGVRGRGQHRIHLLPVKALRHRDVLVPHGPGHRHGPAPAGQAQPQHMDAVVLTALIDGHHHRLPAAPQPVPVHRRLQRAGIAVPIQARIRQRPPQSALHRFRQRRSRQPERLQFRRHLRQHRGLGSHNPRHQQRQPPHCPRPPRRGHRRLLDLLTHHMKQWHRPHRWPPPARLACHPRVSRLALLGSLHPGASASQLSAPEPLVGEGLG